MALHYRTSGFVLKKNDIGEADRVFIVFTLDFGKIKILGRAIRKIASKLKGGIDIISLSGIEFIQGKTYKTLTDSVILERFGNIKKDLVKLEISQKIIESLDNLAGNEQKDEKLWDLLGEVLNKINNWNLQAQKQGPQIIYYYFLWNFFSIIGYEPELYKCASCQKKLKEEALYFSAEDGGIICSRCAKDKKRINVGIIKILRIILKKDWQLLSRLKIQPASMEMLEEISEHYYSHLLSIHFSVENMAKIRNENKK
ncbi:DNA repair protein RecO [Patescibacteria group bacterium]|nr:DNA repair protein RecO [Patescibacteria group bacterium]